MAIAVHPYDGSPKPPAVSKGPLRTLTITSADYEYEYEYDYEYER